MPDFLVFYLCAGHNEMDDLEAPLPHMRAVTATDKINAIIAARREERENIGYNCPGCRLAGVKPAS